MYALSMNGCKEGWNNHGHTRIKRFRFHTRCKLAG